MSLTGSPDLGAAVDLPGVRVFRAFGGGAAVVEPAGCDVLATEGGDLLWRLDLVRALDDLESRATFSCTVGAQYPQEEALGLLREKDPRATVTPAVLTDWTFRVVPTPALATAGDLTAPLPMTSAGLGTGTLLVALSLQSGLILESMVRDGGALWGTAEATVAGVSPRVPAVVAFDPAVLVGALLEEADASGTLPYAELVAWFRRDPADLPVELSGSVVGTTPDAFAAALADRVVARFGRWVPAQDLADAPVVALTPSDPGRVSWSLAQPVLVQRRVLVPVDLLGAARLQVVERGLASLVTRRDLATLPSFGDTTVTVLGTLPAARSGVDALGVELEFPPHPPARPQARSATAVLEHDDVVDVTVRLSPGEPPRYRATPFAVLADETGIRRLSGTPVEATDRVLRLGPDAFPVELASCAVSPALAELAVLTGTCTYESGGTVRERPFVLDSGVFVTAVAVPRDRTWLRIDVLATARDGSGDRTLGPFEAAPVRLDLGSFPTYGPQQVAVRCVFDDASTYGAVTLLPDRTADTAENATSIVLTPQAPVRTFRWFASTPFADGIHYRPFGGGAWSRHRPADGELVLFSSQLGSGTSAPVRREVVVRERAALAPRRPRPLPVLMPREVDEARRAREIVVAPVAVSPQDPPTDELVYAWVGTPGGPGYVPRYELDVQTVSGRPEYRVSMMTTAAASTLTVHLVATAAPAVRQQAPAATELPHGLALSLELLLSTGGGATKTLEFTDVTRNGAVVTAVLTFATLAERDDVYFALTDPARGARLVAQRTVDLLVPTAVGPAGDGLLFVRPIRISPVLFPLALEPRPRPGLEPLPSPVLLKALSAVSTLPVPQLAVRGRNKEAGFTRFLLTVANWQDFSDAFFAASPDLPPCGLNTNASRTWVDILDAGTGGRIYGFCGLGTARDLTQLWFAVSDGTPAPEKVQVRLTDRRTGVVQTSPAVPAVPADPPPPQLIPMRAELRGTVAPEPFVFSPVLHAYIFAGMTPGSGGSRLIRHTLLYRGRHHAHLQDATRPWVVYVFPDEFKIARRERAPYSPFVTVRVTSSSDGRVTSVVFDYLIAPHVDQERLADARTRLLADPRFGATSVEFQPFSTDEVVLTVDRPTATGSVREQRPDAAVVLQGALKDTLTMPLGDFRLLFDAMHTPTASLFLGHVAIDVPDAPAEVIPFTARMDDLEGPVFQATATTAADGLLDVTLTNAIESPLDVQTLGVVVTVDERVGAATVRGGLPRVGLRPGQSTVVRVAPDVPITSSEAVELAFDLTGVTVHPDPEAIWDAILDRTAVDYFRVVTVKVLRSVFDPVPGRETEQIQVVVVEFEGGATAELVPTAGTDAFVTATVRIDYPIDDVILHRPIGTGYRYTRTVIRADGRQDRDPAPVTGTGDTLYLDVVR